MTQKSKLRSIRFPQDVYDHIDELARINAQNFTAMTILLLNQALRDPHLIVPSNKKNDKDLSKADIKDCLMKYAAKHSPSLAREPGVNIAIDNLIDLVDAHTAAPKLRDYIYVLDIALLKHLKTQSYFDSQLVGEAFEEAQSK